ncbi:hypothetical protein PENTCL1PPCAC_24313, partial [Pristionchus entomophagus]
FGDELTIYDSDEEDEDDEEDASEENYEEMERHKELIAELRRENDNSSERRFSRACRMCNISDPQCRVVFPSAATRFAASALKPQLRSRLTLRLRSGVRTVELKEDTRSCMRIESKITLSSSLHPVLSRAPALFAAVILQSNMLCSPNVVTSPAWLAPNN